MAKNSTKVRPVAQATKSTGTPLLRAHDKAGSEYYDQHAATAGLSDRKHEDFGQEFRHARAADMRCAIGINHVLGNLFDMRPMR